MLIVGIRMTKNKWENFQNWGKQNILMKNMSELQYKIRRAT